ncbi:MAG TPA: chemotaxis protein CheX [Planctomycetota bacterium]|nr:chemotaxis protein CheX [Planctomycetota bacterium]
MKAIVISEKQLLASQVRQVLGGSSGWSVSWAANIADAKASIDNQTLVILDYEQDPVVATATLKRVQEVQRFNDAPILLVGSKAVEPGLKEAVARGANGYVCRPLEGDSLRAKAEELTKPVGAKTKLDVRLINPFIGAAIEVMKTTVQMEIRRKEIFLKKNYRMFGDISGVMGLSGQASGSVVISMPGPLACLLVGKMLGEEPAAEVNDSVRDGIGELINQISGHAKATLAGSEYHFMLSLPVVISGRGHEIAHRTGAPCIVVVFDAGKEEFAIQVSLSPE